MSRDTETQGSTLLLALLLSLILLALLLVVLKTPGEAATPEAVTSGAAESAESLAYGRDDGYSPPRDNSIRDGSIRADEVAEALLGRRDLIPYEGTLGGTMGFYSRENIEVLNDRWIFAHFEDGHRMGSMLLEYRWRPEGKVEFELLDAALR